MKHILPTHLLRPPVASSGVAPRGDAALAPAAGGAEVSAGELWRGGRGAAVLVLRDARKALCREEAGLWAARREEIEALGFRLVLMVRGHEGAAELAADVWKGDVLVDRELAFFAALAGGSPATGIPAPDCDVLASAHQRYAVAEHGGEPESGEMIAGGAMVVSKDGKLEYGHLESVFGDHAPLDGVFMPLMRRLAKAC
ncbi:hypothetical protein DFJ74DRAFT_709883 [Hyaloraphidium curvatum]|nr:hypothetical protein DFJ74DRAFT_709883 [Hyaloraphidium curvatum]